ncbi:MAG: hypothetical protein AAF542_02950 [Pseudomonadota bacterium]
MNRLCIASLLLLSQQLVAAEPESQEEQQVQAYISQQKAAGIPPKTGNANWKPGYTCNDLKKHSVAEYQECRYYYSVHGRFYPG